MFKLYKCVLQKDEKDCGPACILTILKQYNVNYSIAKLREIVGTDKQGTNLYGLIKGLNYFNFNARAFRIEEKKLNEKIKYPAIAHINNNGFYHFVVINEIKKNKIIISDPAKGVVKYNLEEFYEKWTGIIVLIEKMGEIKNIDYKEKEFIKFLKIVKDKKTLIYNIILISILSILIGISTSFYFKILIDYILKDKLVGTLNVLMLSVIFITFIKIFFEFIKSQLLLFFGQKNR